MEIILECAGRPNRQRPHRYNVCMAQLLHIHPQNPQLRLVRQAAAILADGGLIVYPTDSCYAFGFLLGNRHAAREIRRLRQTSRDHNFTLVCRDLSEIGNFARVENWVYRLLKACTPGPYTFILRATRDVPRRLQHAKRKTVGIRVPDHPIALALLEELGQPMMSSTLLLHGDELPLTDPDEISLRLGNDVRLVIDGGNCGIEPTTVVDLTGDQPAVLREGRGSLDLIQ